MPLWWVAATRGRKLRSQVELVGREQNSLASLASEEVQQAHEYHPVGQVEVGGGLIEQHHGSILDQGAS
jgi:hypothetical protein